MSAGDDIEALHAEFRAGLPTRLARMRALAAEGRAGKRPEAITELATQAHRLRGACGSFAMRELEEPSRLVEAECKRTPDWRVVDAALDQLAGLIA